MKTIPRHWGYAETKVGIPVWRSSPNSQAEAQEEARKAAQRVSEYERDDRNGRPPAEEYPYGVTLREKLLKEINDSQRRLQGFITRNHAGAEVLNARNVMFLDWDTPEKISPARSLFQMFSRWFRRIFSNERNLALATLTSDDAYDPIPGFWRERYPWSVDIPELKAFMSKVDSMLADWSVRIYKTAAGYRGIVTHALFDPVDRETIRLMEQFACDPQYIRLCQKQESFRARLTPKGSRVGLWPFVLGRGFCFRYPRADYPCTHEWMSAELYHETEKLKEKQENSENSGSKIDIIENLAFNQKIYDEAVKVYEEASAPFATCRYLGTVGSEFVHPEVRQILDLHDEATRALNSEELTLA